MRNLKYLMSVVVAGGALAACDTDESPCITDAECGGYLCVVADGATEGICQATCTTDTDCADAFTCGGETGTECVASTVTCAETDCGAYTCAEPGICATGCTADTMAANCIEGTQCDETGEAGLCIALTADPFVYVAVVSRVTAGTGLDNPNPGPDLDFISATSGGSEGGAASVVSSAQGQAGTDENTRPLSSHAGAVLVQDTVDPAAAANCDLDIGDGDDTADGYVSIGGDGGFIAVQFANEFVNGDTVTITEVDASNCASATIERPDAYEVFVSNMDPTSATAADIGTTWCLLGASGGNGGTTTFTVDTCLTE